MNLKGLKQSFLWSLCASAIAPLCLFAQTLDAKGEMRARHLDQEIRCVSCQSQSINDSEAPIALDLRRDIRRQIQDGRTDAQIRESLQKRYGEYILLRPKISGINSLLWLFPPFIVLAGFGFLIRRKLLEKDRPQTTTPPKIDTKSF
jgi:cytochrome c-type biogenesis protein CcmH